MLDSFDPRWVRTIAIFLAMTAAIEAAAVAQERTESRRVYRRVHSERGWDPWDDPASIPQKVRERAIRMVFDHTPEHPSQWAAIRSVGEEKLGIPDGVLAPVRQAERDTGQRPGLTSSERDELKRLQRENVGCKRANEILRKASWFSAQAVDRRPK